MPVTDADIDAFEDGLAKTGNVAEVHHGDTSTRFLDPAQSREALGLLKQAQRRATGGRRKRQIVIVPSSGL